MTTIQLIRELAAKRAARRQYANASERFAQQALRELLDHHPDRSKWMALFANDLARWAKAEVCE